MKGFYYGEVKYVLRFYDNPKIDSEINLSQLVL